LEFKITGKHIEITESIRKRAEEKTSKLPKYYDSVNQVEVIVDAGHGVEMKVEIIARGEHGNVFVASEKNKDVYAGIDIAVHKLEEQIKRKKTKERDDKHHSKDSQKNI
jgi:putative sigma-54 modulation protein